MKKFIILAKNGRIDCRVILEESELWLGREALEVNNQESTQRLMQARANGEPYCEDTNNVVTIDY